MDRCSESHGWTTACSSMTERDGKDQREDMFDDTSYFVTVGLSNSTVQLRLLGKVFSDVGTPRVSFVLPNSALLLLSCSPSSFLLLSFSEGNKDVFTLFNLRVSSLTEPGLYEDASDFWKL